MRCISNENISTYDELLVKANMPSLQNGFRTCMCIPIYKVTYATTPTPVSGLLSLRSNKCNQRGKMKFILRKLRANTSTYGLSGGSRPWAKGGRVFFWNVETKLICEYRLLCRLFFLLRLFVILCIYFFAKIRGGGPLDPPLGLHMHF